MFNPCKKCIYKYLKGYCMAKKIKENWFKAYWRQAIAWAFVIIILFDFVIAPSIVFALIKAGVTISMWTSLTLDMNGFFYLGIATILGAAAWTRGQEKIERTKKGFVYDTDDESDTDPGKPL